MSTVNPLAHKLPQMIERLGMGVLCLDRHLHVACANGASARVLHKPPDTMEGRHLRDLLPGDIAPQLVAAAVRTLKTRQSVDFEFYCPLPMDAVVNFRFVPSDDGVDAFLEELKEEGVGEALPAGTPASPVTGEGVPSVEGRAAQPVFYDFYDALNQAILEFDGDRRLVSANAEASRILGLNLGGMVGTTDLHVLSMLSKGFESNRILRRMVELAITMGLNEPAKKKTKKMHVQIRAPENPEPRWYSLEHVTYAGAGVQGRPHVFIILTDTDELMGGQTSLQIANLDLTRSVETNVRDLMEANIMLDEQREILQRTLDNIPVMILLNDAAGRVRLVNREIERLTGWTLEKALESDIFPSFFPNPMDLGEFWHMAFQGATGWHDFNIATRTGAMLPTSWTSVRTSDGSMIAIGIDISARQEMERQVSRLASAMEQAGDGIALIDRAFRVHYVNRAFEEMAEKGRDEVVGKRLDTLQGLFWNEGGEKVARELLDGLQSVSGSYSGTFTRKRANGTDLTVTVNISPVYDEAGRVADYVAVLRDITEMTGLQNQLAQAQRIDALDRFAGGIAHDLNNLLAPIVLNLEELLADEPVGTERREILSEALHAASRQRELIRKILTFGRRGEHTMKPFRVGPLLEESLSFLRSSLPSTIEIRQHVDAPADVIVGDTVQIQQVILNLCRNSADALKNGKGTISVGLADTRLTSSHRHYGLRDGEYLKLTVKDTGSGMKPDVMERIFDPFFTTKGVGKGTGMGLSIAYGIVKAHGGTITVESGAGKGTLFTVYLPVREEAFSDQTAQASPEASTRGHGKILLVDDEEMVLASMQRVLKAAGYQVEAFRDSAEALQAFSHKPGGFDLVITDLTMPGMTGEELARKIMKVRPGTPVVLCTGYNDVVSCQNAKRFGITRLLLKPVGAGELKKVIGQVLGHG